MAATTNQLMTVEEFRKLPEDDGPVYQELRHGELIEVPRPKRKHHSIQTRLMRLLGTTAPADGYVSMEVPFQAGEKDLRVADVAFVPGARWSAPQPDDFLHGAPDIVVEVLSPSNRTSDLYDKEKLCLENGAKEFWVVDPERRQVKVSTPDGHTVTYRSGQDVPLPLFGGDAKIPVDAIFD